MSFAPWWVGGLLLATAGALHWLTTRRLLAVSGRITRIIDRARMGPSATADMNDDDLAAAMAAATAAEFGDAAGTTSPAPGTAAHGPVRETARDDLLFLGGLVGGGVIAGLAMGRFALRPALGGETFARLFGAGPTPAAIAVLLVGGVLVGFGTRMGGGCTSGHGLSGVSRLQPGSLLNTAVFFASGIGVSLLLGVLR